MADKTLEKTKTEQSGIKGEYDNYINHDTGIRTRRVKKPLINRLLSAVIPMRGDTAGETVRKAIFLVSVLAVIICGFLILKDMSTENRQTSLDLERSELKQEVEVSGVIPLDIEKIEKIQKEAPGILDKYVALYDSNPDIVGWITIADTPIDYPVMQYTDNDFYLYRDFNKNNSVLGSIFADYHVKLQPDSRPNNTVLYGHNISSGIYFAKLTNYYPKYYGSLNFYTTHPTISFDTIYEEGTYKVFAGMYINTETKHGDVYEYYRKRSFKNKAEFYDFTQNILDRSAFYTDVDLEYGDEILTLSTCYYPLGNDVDTRFVVFARRVREGESTEVDVSKAYINPSPLYFDYYYRVNGGSWAGRTWDLSLVKGFEEFLLENIPAEAE